MLTIEYESRSGEAVADGRAVDTVNNIIDRARRGADARYTYATENIFYAFRIAILEGKVDFSNVKFKFRDQLISIDHNGNLDAWPPGFCDATDRYLETLIGWKK